MKSQSLRRTASVIHRWILLGLAGSSGLSARASDAPPAVVSHVLVTSKAVPDVSSLEAWKRSFLRDGMSDAEKAMAAWNSVVMFRHQDNPPDEFLHNEANVHDPIKTFNVYGYGMCCCAACNVAALARFAGLEARGRIVNRHSVPEIRWDGRWRLLDASLICWFPGPDGQPLGVDDLIAGVADWFRTHPDLRGNDAKLRAFMTGGGWRKGPAALASCPFYDDNGWLPAATHGWYSTMQEYDCKPGSVYEYGYSQGYEVNIRLRPGERLTRRWSNRGLHVNRGSGGTPGCLDGRVGHGDLRYTPRYGDIAPGRIGNGTLNYDVPLASSVLRATALLADNLAPPAPVGKGTALRAFDPAKPAALVVRMPCSYVYLTGTLRVKATIPSGGAVGMSLSDNNGLDWKPVAVLRESGDHEIDLGPHVFRRYDYRLKIDLSGAGTGLHALRFSHDIQCSQRALPALVKGDNTISFRAGPPEDTVTLEGNTSDEFAAKKLNLNVRDFHPVLRGVSPNMLRLEGATGEVTFAVATPGEMTRLRFGGFYRARDAADGWDFQVSFDGGRTFRTVGRADGPFVGNCMYVTVDDIPVGARNALVRFAGAQRNTLCLFDYRIDADYREPAGGFRPVRIVYTWEEDGVKKNDVHVARQPGETYRIACAGTPVMKSIALELAD